MSEFASPAQRSDRAIQIFDQIGGVLEGHFVYAAGHHGNAYVAKDETIKQPDVLAEMTLLMAENLAEVLGPDDIDALYSAAPCGSIVASRMTEHLGKIWGTTPGLIFAEKEPYMGLPVPGGNPYVPELKDRLVLKRGFDKDIVGKRLHMVEDIVNSGKTVVELAELALSYTDVTIVGCSAEYSRTPSKVSGESLNMDPWLPLVERELSKAEPEDCTMCEDLEAYPIRTDRGHGKEFLAQLTQLAEAQA